MIKLSNVQTALYEKLEKHFNPKNIGVGDIFNEETSPVPFIFLGDMEKTINSTKTYSGNDITTNIWVFTNRSGKKQAHEIVEEIESLLTPAARDYLKVEGVSVIDQKFGRVRVFEDNLRRNTGHLVFEMQTMEVEKWQF